MPPNLKYYKSSALHNATRNKNGNGNTGNRNKTLRPTLKRNIARRNLFKNVRVAHIPEVKNINSNNTHEENLNNGKYHGTKSRKGLGNSYMEKYHERLAQMTQA